MVKSEEQLPLEMPPGEKVDRGNQREKRFPGALARERGQTIEPSRGYMEANRAARIPRETTKPLPRRNLSPAQALELAAEQIADGSLYGNGNRPASDEEVREREKNAQALRLAAKHIREGIL